MAEEGGGGVRDRLLGRIRQASTKSPQPSHLDPPPPSDGAGLFGRIRQASTKSPQVGHLDAPPSDGAGLLGRIRQASTRSPQVGHLDPPPADDAGSPARRSPRVAALDAAAAVRGATRSAAEATKARVGAAHRGVQDKILGARHAVVDEKLRPELVRRLDAAKENALQGQVDMGMPVCLHTRISAILDNGPWPRARDEFVDMVCARAAGAEIYPPLAVLAEPGPCCCVAWWRYYYLPFDQTRWQRWRNPLYAFVSVLHWLPLWCVPQTLLALRLPFIDLGEEYQLLHFFTGLKIAQFMAYAVVNGAATTVRLYICTVGLSELPLSGVAAEDGYHYRPTEDGMLSWPECGDDAISIPLCFFLLVAAQALAGWSALLLLRCAASKGSKRWWRAYWDRSAAEAEEEMPDLDSELGGAAAGAAAALQRRPWHVMRKWLVYDVVCAAACAGLVAWAMHHHGWYRADEWDPAERRGWRLRCTLDVALGLYGTLALPFVLMHAPLFAGLLGKARRTGYAPSGVSVDHVGLNAYRRPDGELVPADVGPPYGRTPPPPGAARAAAAEAAEAEADAEEAPATGGDVAPRRREAFKRACEEVRDFSVNEQLKLKVTRDIIPWALNDFERRSLRHRIIDPYMYACARDFATAIWEPTWDAVASRVGAEVLVAWAGKPPAPDGAAGRCLAAVRYRLFPYDRPFWQCIRDPVWFLWHFAGKLCPLFGVGPLVMMAELALIDREDEHQLVLYIVDFKSVQFLAIGVVQTAIVLVQLFGCVSAQPPTCSDAFSWHGWKGANNAANLAAFTAQITVVWAAFCRLDGARRKGDPAGGKAAAEAEARAVACRVRLRRLLQYDIAVLGVVAAMLLAAGFAHSNPAARVWGAGAPAMYDNWRFAIIVLLGKAAYGLSAFPFLAFLVPPFSLALSRARPTGYGRDGATRAMEPKTLAEQAKAQPAEGYDTFSQQQSKEAKWQPKLPQWSSPKAAADPPPAAPAAAAAAGGASQPQWGAKPAGMSWPTT